MSQTSQHRFLNIGIILVCFCSINAEYLVLKKHNGSGLEPLDQTEHAKIYQTIMRYQFPANINPENNISDEERTQVLKKEQVFIQDKLTKLGPYELVFVPTTLYELYILDSYLDYHSRVLLILDWFLGNFGALIDSRNLATLTREQAMQQSQHLSLSPRETKDFQAHLKRQTKRLHSHMQEIDKFLIKQQALLIDHFNATIDLLKKSSSSGEEFKKELDQLLKDKDQLLTTFASPGSTEPWVTEYLNRFTQEPFTFASYVPLYSISPTKLNNIAAQLISDTTGSQKDIQSHLQQAHFFINQSFAQELFTPKHPGLLEETPDGKQLTLKEAQTLTRRIIRNFSNIISNPKEHLLAFFGRFATGSKRPLALGSYTTQDNKYILARIATIIAQTKSFVDIVTEIQLVLDQCFGEQRGFGHHTINRILSTEYDAHHKQQALIYRGEDAFEADGKKYFILPFAPSKDVPAAYSASFGISLFGGIFKDTAGGRAGANAFQFMCRSKLAIIVRINKKEYSQSIQAQKNIVFIPPYTELTVLLLGSGETFHVRTTTWHEALKFEKGGGATIQLHGTILPWQEYMQLFGNFFADSTEFVRSVCPKLRPAGIFNDEAFEKELRENTRNIGNFAIKQFASNIENLTKADPSTMTPRKLMEAIPYLTSEKELSDFITKLTPDTKSILTTSLMRQNSPLAISFISTSADISTIDILVLSSFYCSLKPEQQDRLTTYLTKAQKQDLLQIFMDNKQHYLPTILQLIKSGTDVDNRTLSSLYSSLTPKQQDDLVICLTGPQKQGLLRKLIYDPEHQSTAAIQLIKSGVDIPDIPAYFLTKFYEALTKEQQEYIFTKLTPEQQEVIAPTPVPSDITDIKQIIKKYSQKDDILFLPNSNINSIDGHVFEQIAEQFPGLKLLFLSENPLMKLPPEIALLRNLQILDINKTRIAPLPLEILKLQNLRSLFLNQTPLTAIPPEIAQLQNLQTLELESTPLATLPPEIGLLQSLQDLSLNDTSLVIFPPEILKLTNLKSLRLNGTPLTALPPKISQLQNLQVLSLDNTQLATLPPEIGQLQNLQILSLNGTQVASLPPEIAQLSKLQSLHLYNTPLATSHDWPDIRKQLEKQFSHLYIAA